LSNRWTFNAALPADALGGMLRLLDGSSTRHPISAAPFHHDVEVRAADGRGGGVIPFPCRQTTAGWINADLGVRVHMEPREWRDWLDEHVSRAVLAKTPDLHGPPRAPLLRMRRHDIGS
jgi:hypothetical protein